MDDIGISGDYGSGPSSVVTHARYELQFRAEETKEERKARDKFSEISGTTNLTEAKRLSYTYIIAG